MGRFKDNRLFKWKKKFKSPNWWEANQLANLLIKVKQDLYS